ncbi:O-antigen ligase family protein [bacterium]|nr:O-antigen ligase family protein [candidate division CSSED10-310 bacterium]
MSVFELKAGRTLYVVFLCMYVNASIIIYVFFMHTPLKWSLFTLFLVPSMVYLLRSRKKIDICFFLFFLFLFTNIDYWPYISKETSLSLLIRGFRIQIGDIFLILLLIFCLRLPKSDDDCYLILKPVIILPIVCMAFLMAVNVLRSNESSTMKAILIYEFLKCTIPIIIFSRLRMSNSRIRLLFIAFGTILSLNIIIGLLQHFSNGMVGLTFLGESKVTNATYQGMTVSRVTGLSTSPNTFSMVIGLLVPICIAGFFFPHFQNHQKIFICFPLLLGGLLITVFSHSRNGLISMILGVNFVLFCGLKKKLKRGISAFLIVLVLLCIGAGLMAIFFPIVYQRLFTTDFNVTNIRVPMVENAWELIKDNCLFGVGMGNYYVYAPKYDFTPIQVSHSFPWPIHNEYLLVWSEMGIMALILYVALFFTPIVYLIKTGFTSNYHYGSLCFGFAGSLLSLLFHMLSENYSTYQSLHFYSLIGVIYGILDASSNGQMAVDSGRSNFNDEIG